MPWPIPTPPTNDEFVRQRFERSIKPLLEYTDSSTETAILGLVVALLIESRLRVSGSFQEYAWKLVRPKLEQLKGIVNVKDEAALREALYRFALEARVYCLRDA